jgi:hypothetical protein
MVKLCRLGFLIKVSRASISGFLRVDGFDGNRKTNDPVRSLVSLPHFAGGSGRLGRSIDRERLNNQ